jgi:PadR family transcriptional regulator PadR
VRRTYALIQVAIALMADPDRRHWGYQLSKRSGVRSGVMYPLLQRMLDEGWLTDGWEEQAQTGRAKRPPRRYYQLTDGGRKALGAAITGTPGDARFVRLTSLRVVEGEATSPQVIGGRA